jgi:two-component system chemotaxis sensor kinase CheA
MGIAMQQHLLANVENSNAQDSAESENAANNSEIQEFLLFTLSTPTKYALPLNLVHRLEEFKRKNIEFSGNQRIVRYGNTILPLLSLNEHLNFSENSAQESETISVIVCRKSDRPYGIEVNEILDVLTTSDSVDDGISDRPGILGNLVTSNQVIVIVDALQILDSFSEELSGNEKRSPTDTTAQRVKSSRHILLVEDTTFFKKHIGSVLERAGYKVSYAANGLEALTFLDKAPSKEIDLILSDIEMPKMNGLELAKSIRNDQKWNGTPLIAITTRYSPEFAKEGRTAGFDSYLEKLKPDELLAEIESSLSNIQERSKIA